MRIDLHRSLMIGLLAVMAASMGCYTLLKHPRLKSADDATEGYQAESVSHGNDCLSCHSSADLDNFAIGVPHPRPYTSQSWDYYYDWPWWNSYYADPESDDQAENEKRPFDRRRQSPPPEASSSSAAAPAPAELPAGSLARPSGSGDSTSAPASDDQADDGKRPFERRRQSPPRNPAPSSSGDASAPADNSSSSLSRPSNSGDNTSSPPPASSTDSGKREGRRSSDDAGDQSSSSSRRERKP